jgi:hypothetical protein
MATFRWPRYLHGMSRRDEDDWVGEPPEGRYGKERADPDYWRRDWRPAAAWAGTALALLILLLVLLLA